MHCGWGKGGRGAETSSDVPKVSEWASMNMNTFANLEGGEVGWISDWIVRRSPCASIAATSAKKKKKHS